MSTLTFDGSDDFITGSGHGAMNGAFTIAFLMKHVADWGVLFGLGPTPKYIEFIMQPSGIPQLTYNDVSRAASTAVDHTSWWIVVVTHAASPSTPRFHFKNIASGAWIHQNSAAGSHTGTFTSRVGDLLNVGRGANTSNEFTGEMGLVSWWDGRVLTDLEIESLATNKKTSDWNVLAPSSLTELNTLTPVDLKALETWTRNGPVLTGTDPPGWTFDGVGTPPEPEPEPEPEDVPIRIRSSKGWIDLTGSGGGDIEFYEQEEPPETDTLGAIWVKQEPMP